tara:strand:+ start:8460 stop:9173 length:714 start_codon:yes stop_codon:yes gene_type:complete
MSKKKKCICIIPARAGSKRIKKKNIKLFFGKPIIGYSIETAIKSKCFDKVIVSTDSLEIAKISKKYRAEILFMRPKHLSNDKIPLAPVIKHSINQLRKMNIDFDNICVLTATAPILSYLHLKKSLKVFKKNNSKFLASVNLFNYPIQRALGLKKRKLFMIDKKNFNTRSQDLAKTYHDAGQFYWCKSDHFKKNSKILIDDTTPYLLKNIESVDIDTPEDWQHAKNIFRISRRNNTKK